MDNRNRRRRSILDELFSNGFFSMGDFSFPEMEGDGFPQEGDPNFNKTEEVVDTGTHSVKKETWVSIDGTQRFERTSMSSKQAQKTLKKPSKEELKFLLDKAVEDQEYEKAIEYRDALNKLK